MPNKVILSPPPSVTDEDFPYQWLKWFESVFTRVGEGPLKVRGYSKDGLPTASEWGDATDFSSLIYVSDDVGGSTLAFSDGTDWRRVQDRSIIS